MPHLTKVTLLSRERLIELEAVRGIASVLVLVHHCLLGFAPSLHGLVAPPRPWSLFGTPFFAFIDGSAAVVIFFVLSGFVLTYRAIEHDDPKSLLSGALKRWPRLALPVLISTMIGGLLAALNLYWNVASDNVIGSIWLGWFYRTSPYPIPDFLAPIYEGTVATFLFGQAYFNSNLWTMFYEFFGSFLAFALAYIFIARHALLLIATAVAAAVLLYFSPYFLCFIVGVILATARHHWSANTAFRIPQRWRTGLVTVGAVIAIVLFGYHERLGSPASMGFYEFLRPWAAYNPLATRVVMHTTGAVIVLLLALEFPGYLRTRFAGILGELSFPIYLLHIPLICSVGSYLYLVVLPGTGGVGAAATAIAAVMATTIMLAIPLARIDRAWLAALRRFQMRFQTAPASIEAS
jgi:peptidoglycan/LPS O-acetylase OafA/YrhL